MSNSSSIPPSSRPTYGMSLSCLRVARKYAFNIEVSSTCGDFRLYFAYNVHMGIGGYRKQVDYGKLGPTLTIAASLILAIRTARWPLLEESTTSRIDWDAEVGHAVRLAGMVLSHLTAHKEFMFQQKDVAWHVANDDDVPK